MTVSLPFQQQFTWRKLGYLFYTDSLEYRAVLERNPQWSVTELPPIGAQIRLPDPSSSVGTLQQSSFLTGTSAELTLDDIYPFDTVEEYEAALNKYTLQGVVEREALNGYSADSSVAVTGVQLG
jgi:hypothetical protein